LLYGLWVLAHTSGQMLSVCSTGGYGTTMRYTSTRNTTVNVSFEQALTSGYAPDGGLFVPRWAAAFGDRNNSSSSTKMSLLLPSLDGRVLRSWQPLSYPALLQAVLRLFIDVTEVADDDLQRICHEALQGFRDPQYAVPLVELRGESDDNDDADDALTIVELFHGPTFCFKDLGMRAVLGLLQHFGQQRQRTITLLVSTTGDTGPAAAQAVADQQPEEQGFLKLAVHYPHEQISDFQRRQMTCLQSPKNIQVIAFDGGGDDMDAPIKAFLQHQEDETVVRTGINSYNIVRSPRRGGCLFRLFLPLRVVSLLCIWFITF
jgi:threonine synthase